LKIGFDEEGTVFSNYCSKIEKLFFIFNIINFLIHSIYSPKLSFNFKAKNSTIAERKLRNKVE
jgi:hypothetical protein